MAKIKSAGVIGAGVIGSGWIARLLLNGVNVCVFDPSKDAPTNVDKVIQNAERAYKNLLKSKNIEYEERNIAHGTWTVQQLQEAVPGVRTVPKIFVDDAYVGGYQELKTLLEKESNE